MKLFYLLFVVLCLPVSAAIADEATPLRFTTPSQDVRTLSVIDYLGKEAGLFTDLPYDVAEADLNSDGIDEWIVRQGRSSNCEASATCNFLIAGLKERKPVLLGNIMAGKINLLSQEFYGVRSLFVYANPSNDLEGKSYDWSPYTASFAPRF